MSFLQNYHKALENTEPHPTFHTFCGLATLSALLSRRAWTPMGFFDVFANLYVVLVSPPGFRKSSALNPAEDLLHAVGDTPIQIGAITPQKLIEDMQQEERIIKDVPDDFPKEYRTITPMACIATELSNFLGGSALTMVDFLTTVWDRKRYPYRTKGAGTQDLIGPYLTLLSATTPSWITNYLKQDVISGGFARRAIFAYEFEEHKRITFPETSDESRKAWEACIVHGKLIQAKCKGPFIWTPASREWIDDWYKNKLEIPDDEVVAGYYRSKQILLIKLAMLIAISETFDLKLHPKYFEVSLGLLDLTERNLTKVFEGVGRNELHAIGQKVITLLDMNPAKELSEKRVMAALSRDANSREIYEILQQLQKSEKIFVFTRTNKSTGVTQKIISLHPPRHVTA